jgi:hypothetical protein
MADDAKKTPWPKAEDVPSAAPILARIAAAKAKVATTREAATSDGKVRTSDPAVRTARKKLKRAQRRLRLERQLAAKVTLDAPKPVAEAPAEAAAPVADAAPAEAAEPAEAAAEPAVAEPAEATARLEHGRQAEQRQIDDERHLVKKREDVGCHERMCEVSVVATEATAIADDDTRAVWPEGDLGAHAAGQADTCLQV